MTHYITDRFLVAATDPSSQFASTAPPRGSDGLRNRSRVDEPGIIDILLTIPGARHGAAILLPDQGGVIRPNSW